MNNNQESNYFVPVLSAIAGIGAIITVLSPFLLQNKQISALFIDSNAIQFSTILAILIAVVSIWYSSSNRWYDTFPSNKSVIFRLIIVFLIFTISFYSLKPIALSNFINLEFASVLQLMAYIFGYFILSSIVGILLRDSFNAYRYQKIQDQKFDKFREALFKSGILKSELVIHSIVQRKFDNNELNLIGSHNVIFTASKHKYFAIVSSDYSQILHSESYVEPIINKI